MREAFERFHAAHHNEYGHAFPGSTVEIVNIRVTGSAASQVLKMPTAAGGALDKARVKTDQAKFRVGDRLETFETAFYRRADLPLNTTVPGPAIILQLDATTLVPPNWTFRADEHGNLILSSGEAK
jgi:N-methylhydantoinase A/oxoprolinase/acetone carboxylase beta subunit